MGMTCFRSLESREDCGIEFLVSKTGRYGRDALSRSVVCVGKGSAAVSSGAKTRPVKGYRI